MPNDFLAVPEGYHVERQNISPLLISVKAVSCGNFVSVRVGYNNDLDAPLLDG